MCAKGQLPPGLKMFNFKKEKIKRLKNFLNKIKISVTNSITCTSKFPIQQDQDTENEFYYIKIPILAVYKGISCSQNRGLKMQQNLLLVSCVGNLNVIEFVKVSSF